MESYSLPGGQAIEAPRFAPALFAPVTEADLKRVARGMLHNFSGMFLSLDGEADLPWSGMPELQMLSIVALDPRIERIEARPERVTVIVNGRSVSRIPAFRLDCGLFSVAIDVVARPLDRELTEALTRAYGDRTPRDVVAQALDYASWVEGLQPEEIAAIYGRFAPGRSLAADFQARFGEPLDEDQLNADHQIVIVAAALDADSERIVEYLGRRGIAINVLCFQVFAQGGQQFLSRAWLRDPAAELPAEPKLAPGVAAEPWNGEFYASYGTGKGARSWADAVTYGFISAGGASWYSKTLNLLHEGDRIWVKAPEHGFVGVGIVTGPAEPAKTFRVKTAEGAEVPVLDAAKDGNYHRDYVDDPERCDYFVPVRWLQTVPVEKAVKEIGLFGNQNTVCRPTTPKWRLTVERLKVAFPNWQDAP